MVIKRTTKKNAVRYVSDFARFLKRREKLHLKGVYLFGSYAKGKQRDGSDIDMAIVSEEFRGRRDPYIYLARRRRDIDLDRRIEAVGFHPRDFVWENPLAAEVKQHGIRIKV